MDFSTFVTISDWSNALQELISLANEAVKNDDNAAKSDLQDVLMQYQSESPPHVGSFDTIAAKVSLELNKANRVQILKNLSDLSTQLKNLNNIVDVATQEATQSTKEIQLKNVSAFLNKAKKSLTILTGLREDFNDPDADIGKKVVAIFEAIEEFERVFPPQD